MNAGAGILLRVVAATIAIGGTALFVGSFSARATRRTPVDRPAGGAPVVRLDRDSLPPIEAEARVFASVFPVPSEAERRRSAHPRTLATFRALRAFPGAPPRIPHGLTADEFRQTRCRTCHERGGYSLRFEAYAPVTPHPELTDCLQCHVADDAVVGVSFPGDSPDALCGQCHASPRGLKPVLPATDWRGAAWPEPQAARMPGTPPAIPHDLELRGDCVACHAGPAAVAEIRTDHAQWSSCLQCHVTAATAGLFSRTRGAP